MHHLGGGKAALGFGPDRFCTLVSIIARICYNEENLVSTQWPLFLILPSSFLQVRSTTLTIKFRTGSNVGPIRPRAAE